MLFEPFGISSEGDDVRYHTEPDTDWKMFFQLWRENGEKLPFTVADHLRPKDGEPEDAGEARLEEFQDAIQNGGEAWEGYLAVITRAGDVPNVVALQH